MSNKRHQEKEEDKEESVISSDNDELLYCPEAATTKLSTKKIDRKAL